MTMRVQLFAGAREAAGADSIAVDLTEPAAVGDLRSALADACPALAAWLPSCQIAVNAEYAALTTPIAAGDEIALIPPVSGG